MESNNTDTDIGDKCNTNGDCSPTPKKQSFDLNNAKNIDDISTPSELKFDEGIVNNYLDNFITSYLHVFLMYCSVISVLFLCKFPE